VLWEAALPLTLNTLLLQAVAAAVAATPLVKVELTINLAAAVVERVDTAPQPDLP
jgi:hypothetical protein